MEKCFWGRFWGRFLIFLKPKGFFIVLFFANIYKNYKFASLFPILHVKINYE